MSRTLRLGLLAAGLLVLIWVSGAPSQVYQRPPSRYRPYYPYSTTKPAAPLTAPERAAPLTAPSPRVLPKLEPVAETKLLMEGMANPNFRGLERLLKQKPADAQTWAFARGQALLIGETANLLMLRPPHNQGQPVWFERAMDLRKAAIAVARDAASEDFVRTRTAFVDLANSCNRCHQAFRVAVEIVPFQEAPAPPPAKTSLAP
jgi:hypothetical protein